MARKVLKEIGKPWKIVLFCHDTISLSFRAFARKIMKVSWWEGRSFTSKHKSLSAPTNAQFIPLFLEEEIPTEVSGKKTTYAGLVFLLHPPFLLKSANQGVGHSKISLT